MLVKMTKLSFSFECPSTFVNDNFATLKSKGGRRMEDR